METTVETLESQIEKLRAAHAEKARKNALEITIREEMGRRGLSPRMVHVATVPLYGSVASVMFGDEYKAGGSDVTAGELAEIERALPPGGAKYSKGACLSIEPARWESENANQFPISPVWFEVSELGIEAKWYADLPGIGLVRVAVHLSRRALPLASPSCRRVDYMGGWRFEQKRLNPAGWCRQIVDENGAVLAERGEIQWWSSETDSGRWAIYWKPAEGARAVSVDDLIRMMPSNP